MASTGIRVANPVPPVVGGRYGPVMGLRRNAVEYSEAMWREHGDVVRLRIGPPGLDREMWMFHHPDVAARIFSGSTWRAFAKRRRAAATSPSRSCARTARARSV